MRIRIIKAGLKIGRENIPIGRILKVRKPLPWTWQNYYEVVARDPAPGADFIAASEPTGEDGKDPEKKPVEAPSPKAPTTPTPKADTPPVTPATAATTPAKPKASEK